jgi:predicted O-methyltransferase YrrM
MKKLLLIGASFLSFNFLPAIEIYPSPYFTLKQLFHYNDMGFYNNEAAMTKLLQQRRAKVVIELGSWLGKSTRHFAKVIPWDGVVYAVDHWLGSVEHHQDFQQYLPSLYDQFLSNVIHTNLTHKIVPLRMTTLEAAVLFKQQGVVPDVVYVDASHDEDSVYADLVAYYPLVKGHGILCGDDWGWGNGLPIQRAVQRFAVENQLRIDVQYNWFWILNE